MTRRRTETTSRSFPWRLLVAAALVVYGILLVIFNSDQVEISFVFFTARAPLLAALVLAGALGCAAGWLVGRRRGRTPD